VPDGSSEVEELQLAGRKPLSTCTHTCGCAPKSFKTFLDQGTSTDFVEHSKPKLIETTAQTDAPMQESQERKVLIDRGTNTEIFYSVNWDESSDDDRRVPDCDDKENVDPSHDIIKNLRGVLLPRESECTPRPYDGVLQKIISNPDFTPPQSYLDDMRWASSDSE